jgi:hypothetical protein
MTPSSVVSSSVTPTHETIEAAEKSQVVDMKINVALTQQLKARDGQNGFVFRRDALVSTTSVFMHVKDAIARQLLLVQGSYEASKALAAPEARDDAAQQVLAILNVMRRSQSPTEGVSLTSSAQYLGATR